MSLRLHRPLSTPSTLRRTLYVHLRCSHLGHRRHFYPVGFRCTSRHRRGDNLAPSAGGRERRHKARPKTWRTRETCRARSMNASGVSGMKFAPGRLGKALTESRLTARRCIFAGCCSGVGVDDRGLRRTKESARPASRRSRKEACRALCHAFVGVSAACRARFCCVLAARGFLPFTARDGPRFAAGFARRGCGLPNLSFCEFRVRIQRFAAGCTGQIGKFTGQIRNHGLL